jgi:hypothetical protein
MFLITTTVGFGDGAELLRGHVIDHLRGDPVFPPENGFELDIDGGIEYQGATAFVLQPSHLDDPDVRGKE